MILTRTSHLIYIFVTLECEIQKNEAHPDSIDIPMLLIFPLFRGEGFGLPRRVANIVLKLKLQRDKRKSEDNLAQLNVL